MATDIVIPFFNGLHHLRQCLRSVALFTEGAYRLYLVDDCSDAYVEGAVRNIARAFFTGGQVTILRNHANRGFLGSANRGLRQGNSDAVVLLNSDTVVTPGWLQKMSRHLQQSAEVGIVCPLSNHANFTRIEFVSGATFMGMSQLVETGSQAVAPDIGIASGFCFLIRRSVVNRLGAFDPAFGRGYYEEADLCLRAAEVGYRTVAAADTFVYHHGWGSFGVEGRNAQMRTNQRVFEQRWGRAHQYLKEAFIRTRPFEDLEMRVRAQLRRESAGGDPTRSGLSGPGLISAFRRLAPSSSGYYWFRGLKRPDLRRRPWRPSDRTGYGCYRAGRWLGLAKAVEAKSAGRANSTVLRILYILPGIGPYGGVISVIQLVNRLLLRGLDAQVATYGDVDPNVYDEQMFFRPWSFRTRHAMLTGGLPRYDLIVATRWDTVFDAMILARQWRSKVVSFVQDYEPGTLVDGSEEQMSARLSLRMVSQKIVKSDWLARELAETGGEVHRIPIGLNLDVFYPGYGRSLVPRRVVIFSRPGVPHRNLAGALAILEALEAAGVPFEAVFIGRTFPAPSFRHRQLGILSQSEVARALREATALLDASLFQGLGRPGLEAMACGVVPVLTKVGGINEYAVHEGNCLQFDPTKAEDGRRALERVLTDGELRQRLRNGGLETVRRYGAEREADSHVELLRQLAGD